MCFPCCFAGFYDILQLAVALSAICGIVRRSVQQDLGKANAQTRGLLLSTPNQWPKKRLHHCCVALMGFTFLAVKHCTQFPGVESHEPSGCSARNWYCEGSREKDMQVLAGCSR